MIKYMYHPYGYSQGYKQFNIVRETRCGYVTDKGVYLYKKHYANKLFDSIEQIGEFIKRDVLIKHLRSIFTYYKTKQWLKEHKVYDLPQTSIEQDLLYRAFEVFDRTNRQTKKEQGGLARDGQSTNNSGSLETKV